MGFIQSNHSRILFNSTMISFNVRRIAARPTNPAKQRRPPAACLPPLLRPPPPTSASGS